jgi:excisionase family DNA binding protein
MGTAGVPFSERITCSIKEAAAATGLGRSTLYELMDEGRIEYAKVNSRRLVFVKSLLALLAREEGKEA